MATERPPLELQAELVYPDGTSTRWDKDSQEAKDRPTGITLRTQRYTGFADAQLSLARRIDIDYPDLGLLDGINLIGHDGSVAYEGRIATMPRSLQSAPSVGIQAQGLMSHAKDQPFVETYIDRDISRWSGMSVARRKELPGFAITDGTSKLDEAGQPSIVTGFQGGWAVLPLSEMTYDAGPGIKIGSLYYAWQLGPNVSGASPWEWFAYLVEKDSGLNGLTPGPLLSGASGTKTLEGTGTQRFAVLKLGFGSAGGSSAGTNYEVFWQPAVYGTHGLTRRGPEPGGLYVSDMIANICTRFAPKLKPTGVQETTFPVPHAAFSSETLPYDAWQTLNAYHRWEIAAYEGRELKYWPLDRTDYDWEVRLSDPGTTVDLQGDDSANLANGVIVRYTDLSTFREARLTPEAFPVLKDENPSNPANLNGLKRYTTLSLSVPSTQEGALQIGRAYLAEFNQAQAPGSITITGHVRDRAGHWQQVWKVRSSDRLIIADYPNDRVRIVGESSYDHDRKTVTLAIDSSAKRLDAILARLAVVVESTNLHA